MMPHTRSKQCLVRQSHEQGFTLTEILVALVLAGIVMASLYSAYITQQRAYKTTEDVTAVQQNLRSAMYFIEKDLRMAGYDPRDSGGFGFTNIVSDTQDNVRFTLDKDEDGVAGADDYIAYRFNAADNTLQRDGGGGSFFRIASHISSVSFVFFASEGVTTSNPGSIRTVDVTIEATREGHVRELQTRVLCRNVGL